MTPLTVIQRRGIAVKTALVYGLIEVVLRALDVEDDGGGADGHHDEKEPVFIPFPLTTKRHNPPPYSSSDPEWREFARISKDAELQSKIQSKLPWTAVHLFGR